MSQSASSELFVSLASFVVFVRNSLAQPGSRMKEGFPTKVTKVTKSQATEAHIIALPFDHCLKRTAGAQTPIRGNLPKTGDSRSLLRGEKVWK
jgi:hypothetical protein